MAWNSFNPPFEWYVKELRQDLQMHELTARDHQEEYKFLESNREEEKNRVDAIKTGCMRCHALKWAISEAAERAGE